MTSLASRIQKVSGKLSSMPGVQVLKENCAAPLQAAHIDASEQGGDCLIPADLRSLYLTESGGFVLSWVADDAVFGTACRQGEGVLLAPAQACALFAEHVGVARDIAAEGLDDDAGRQAVVDDWPYWFPVFRFSTGDCFCLEMRTAHGVPQPVVFLEHDVMDGGPNLHGLVVASDVRELLDRWSMLAFVDVYDWTTCVREGELDFSDAQFDRLKAALSHL